MLVSWNHGAGIADLIIYSIFIKYSDTVDTVENIEPMISIFVAYKPIIIKLIGAWFPLLHGFSNRVTLMWSPHCSLLQSFKSCHD